MTVFDWRRFLDENGVDYVETGPNVKTGELNIACPFCGDDPSHHLGMNPENGFWSCWRDPAHASKYPQRLIHALLRCTWAEACRLAGLDGEAQAPVGSLSDLKARIQKLSAGRKPLAIEEQEWARGIHRVGERPSADHPFAVYLHRRGFDVDDHETIVRRYGLRCARTGDFAMRLIFPIYFRKKLIGWTGRDITNRSRIRYKAHPEGPIVRNVLFNFDNAAKGGRVLVLVEGPMDAVKLDFYGREYGVHAVALMGSVLTAPKLVQLAALRQRYDACVLLLDRDAFAKALVMRRHLGLVGATLGRLPDGVDDPGELAPQAARRYARALVEAA